MVKSGMFPCHPLIPQRNQWTGLFFCLSLSRLLWVLFGCWPLFTSPRTHLFWDQRHWLTLMTYLMVKSYQVKAPQDSLSNYSHVWCSQRHNGDKDMSLRSAATSKSGNLYQEAFLILHRFRPGQTVHCMVVCTHPKLFHKMSCSFRLTENCSAKACACFQTRAMRTTWFVKLFLWGLDSHFTWKSQSQLLRTDVCINIWVLQE